MKRSGGGGGGLVVPLVLLLLLLLLPAAFAVDGPALGGRGWALVGRQPCLQLVGWGAGDRDKRH